MRGKKAFLLRILALSLWLCAFAANSYALKSQRYEDSRVSMGCAYTIVVYGVDPARLREAAGADLDEVDRIDRLMSHYKHDSELSRVNSIVILQRGFMSEKKPTDEEWKKLYAAAGRVKEMAPWGWMMEDEVFGVRNPERDEIGFVSVMGSAGEHFAVALYQGSDALYDFLALSEAGADGQADLIGAERVLEIPQLQASFEDRGHLQKEDRDIIKKLDLKFRGANSWPMFRNYAPGMFPWFLSSSEARFLTTALEQLLDVAPRVRDDEDVLFGEGDDDFLVRVPRAEKARLMWEDKIVRIPEPESKEVTPSPLDPQSLESLKQLPEITNILEIELTMMPTPVREKKDRPYFPYMLMLADAQTGMILGIDMLQPMPSLDAMRAELPLKVAEQLIRLGVKPVKINVRTETTAKSLAPLAEALGIRIKLSPKLPALDAALNFYMERMTPF